VSAGRLLPAVLVAACLALMLGNASILGIEIWKIVLAALGLVLFVTAGMRDRRPGN
jgi:membrane-bound ClpP family serine protease